MPLDESLRDPGMDKALRRIEAVQKSGASHLNLSQLKLNALPEAIGQLISLRSLDLDANQLSSLPPEIGQLTSLNSLDLSKNQLSSLPPEIGKLSRLHSLDLSGNQLSALPKTVKSLKWLAKLLLHSNPGLGLPDEILGPTIDSYGTPRVKSSTTTLQPAGQKGKRCES